MSANSSSTFIDPLIYNCSEVDGRLSITFVYYAVRGILLVPLCIFILYLGVQRWRRQQKNQQLQQQQARHSDVFTYHLAVMELLWFLSVFCFLGGERLQSMPLIMTSICLTTINFYGEIFFQVLTCVEHYLAVVHSIAYRGVGAATAVRIRNVLVGCVWLLCGALTVLYGFLPYSQATLGFFCVMPPCLLAVSFCCLSVLRALTRPGPGGRVGDGERVDQSKRRAFLTIRAILAVLWLWFIGKLIFSAFKYSPVVDYSIGCTMTPYMGFLNLPSSLVIPLLYLHRAKKLRCSCSFNSK